MRIISTADIPVGFPMKLTDEELAEVNIALAENARRPPHKGEPMQVWQQFAQIGQNEFANRVQKRFVQETEKLRISNAKFSRRSTWLAVAMFVMAVFAGTFSFLTLRNSRQDIISDEAWQKQQIELLQEQIRVEKKVSEKLDEIITSPATDDQAESNISNNDK